MTKIILTGLLGALIASSAFALTPGGGSFPVAAVPGTAPAVVTPPAPPVEVGAGNKYERETTPLLREISKKQTVLQLRKLDRELEKLDEDALKAQAERDKLLAPPVAAPGLYNPNAPMPAASNSIAISKSNDIQVFMIYGYDDNLYAKIGSGNQGGYVVKRGDVLPDGRVVAQVTANFIEVKKGKSSSKGVERIFVAAKPAASLAATPMMQPLPTSMAPIPSSAPMMFPATGTPVPQPGVPRK